jgi:DNA-binding NarL/FixJ family response regulator
MPIRVFVYDDHAARRESLAALLNMSEQTLCVGVAENCTDVEADMKESRPEVVLMDINMPKADGIHGLKKIKTNFPHIMVLMQTVFDDNEKVFESLRNGASGYILKKDPPQKILDAIAEISNGGAAMNPGIARRVLDYFKPQRDNPLTEREHVVLQKLAEGKSYKMAAAELDISFHTVNSHCKRIYEKLHVQSLGEAIAYYYKHIH